MSTNDITWMSEALRLADLGETISHPNPSVGCVIVRQNQIVGRGYTQPAGEAHAEAMALKEAGHQAAGATVYVTLEPCSFQGRTPSCAVGLVEAGVGRVVVASRDPHSRNAGKGIQILKENGIQVVEGVLEDSARDQLRGHMLRHEQGRPLVRLKLAMSLDGRTALSNGESKWITGPEARADVQKLRARSSALVTGVDTVIADNPSLNVRAEALQLAEADRAARAPRPVYVLDTNLRIPRDARLFSVSDTVVVSGKDEPAGFPVPVLQLPVHEGRIELKALLKTLAERDHASVLFECGATLAGALLAGKLVDELIIYAAPRLMGGSARSLLNLPEIDRMSDLFELDITEVRMVGADIRVTATQV